MSKIDQRIVQMRFDNNNFEAGIKQSSKSLEGFKSQLNFDRERNSLNNLSSASRSFDLSHMASAVDTISNRFSSLGIIGMSVLQNLTNQAIAAGQRIVSSLTIDPVMSGFSEYETKMESIQTILTNTQATTKTVAVGNAQAISSGASKAASSVAAASDAMRDRIIDNKEAELEAYEDALDVKIEAMEKEQEAQIKLLEDQQELVMEALEEQQEEAIDLFKEQYQTQVEEMEKAYEREIELANEAHNEKLAMYDEEYMRKLKVIDEDKYNAIKDIDDQINDIKELTKAEDEARKKKQQAEKMAELEKKIANAEDAEERQRYEKQLSDLKDQIRRDELLKERAEKIESLTEEKKYITEEFNEKKAALKEEYDEKKRLENEAHEEVIKNIKLEQEESEKLFRKAYEEELKQIQKLQEAEREELKETQEEEMDALREIHEADRKEFDKTEEKKRKAIEDRYDAELKAISKRAAASSGGGGVSIGGGGGGYKTITTKGSTMEDVKKALAELNEYADKTIYNFGDMTSAIGKFTAAGVDLDTSVASIKGISNVAAGAGSSAQQASNAMYQLSQAIASGTVRLQDWISVENAGMGGSFFQNELKKTAQDMGIVVDHTKAFRYTLEDGWLTADVMTNTLSRLAEDESLLKAATQVTTFSRMMGSMAESVGSGWAMTWEYILGDKNQSTELWTSMFNAFDKFAGAAADARNNMLQFWNENGGRDAILQGLVNIINTLGDVLRPIGEAFRNVFPPMTGQMLVDASNKFLKLTENIKIGDGVTKAIKTTFEALFTVLKVVFDIVGSGIQTLLEFTPVITEIANVLLTLTGILGDVVTSSVEYVKSTGILQGALEGIQTVISKLSEKFSELLEGSKTVFGYLGGEATEGIKTAFNTVTGVLTGFKDNGIEAISGFAETVSVDMDGAIQVCDAATDKLTTFKEKTTPALDGLSTFADRIGYYFGRISQAINDALGSAELSTILAWLTGGGLLIIIKNIKDFLGGMSTSILGLEDLTKGVVEVLGAVKDSLEAYQNNLKAKTLLAIAGAIATLAGALWVIASIDSDKLLKAVTTISVLFVELSLAMKSFSKLNFTSESVSITKLGIAFVGFGTAILILASALKTISDLKWSELAVGTTGVVALTAALALAAKTLSTSDKDMGKAAMAMIPFCAALLIMSNSLVALSELNPQEMATALAGFVVSLTSIAAALSVIDEKEAIKKATSVLIVSTSLLGIANTLTDLGELSWEQIGVALTGLTGALTAITTALYILPQDAGKKAKGMGSLGITLLLVANTLHSLSELSWDEIARSLAALTGSLAAIALALMNLPSNMTGQAAPLLALSVTLLSVGNTLHSLSTLNWDEIARSLTALGGSLAIIASSMILFKMGATSAPALLTVSAALLVLSGVLTSLAVLNLTQIGIGLTALAGTFAVVGVSGMLMAPLAPVLISLGAGIALLGVSVAATGAGLLMFTTAMTAMIAVGAPGIALMSTAILGFAELIPAVAKSVGEGIVEIIKVLLNAGDEILEGLGEFIVDTLKIIGQFIPDVVEIIYEFLLELLDVFADNAPEFLDAGFDLLTKVLDGVAKGIPNVVNSVVDIVTSFITALSNNLPKIVDAGFKAIISFVEGITKAIDENTMPLIAAFKGLFDQILKSIFTVITGGQPEMAKQAVDLINKFLTAIGDMMSAIGRKGKEIINKIIDNVSLGVKDMYRVGGDIIDGLVDGISGSLRKVGEWAKKIGNTLLDGIKDVLDINSPSREFKMVGDFAGQGLVIGLRDAGDSVYNAGAKMGQTAKDALTSALATTQELIDSDMDSNPTIRPILDLTDVANGVNDMNNLLDKDVDVRGINTMKPSMSTDILEAIKTLIPNPDNPNPTSINNSPTIVFNINSQSGNAKQISRQIQRDLSNYKRALGIV